MSIINRITSVALAGSLGFMALGSATASSAQDFSGNREYLGGVVGCDASGGKQEVGALLGALAGGFAGNALAKHSHGGGAAIGAAVGAAAGSYTGCQMQRSRAREAERAYYRDEARREYAYAPAYEGERLAPAAYYRSREVRYAPTYGRARLHRTAYRVRHVRHCGC